jgi:methionyl-tRNA formyltransferase
MALGFTLPRPRTPDQIDCDGRLNLTTPYDLQPMPDRLRVLLVTEDDPLYVLRLFEVFFREYPRETLEICAITIDRPFHEPPWKTFSRMLGFYGVGGVVRLVGRFLRAKLSGRSIKRLALEHGITLLPTRSVNAPEYLEAVRRMAPDLIVSVAAPEIFRKPILQIPRLGCINIHSGRLPVYRGMMPTFWQMMRGETEITVTVHEMVEVLDGGKVLGTVTVPVTAGDSLDRVITATKQAGARLLITVLEQIRRGEAVGVPVDMSGASYFSFPKREHVVAFRQRGHRLI